MDDPARILARSATIAVVGASGTPGKAAHEVPEALLDAGWDVIPVNPFHEELFGRRCHPDLASVGRRVDLVDVFRPARDAPAVVAAAVEAGARAVWLQLGIVSAPAREAATAAGLDYVEDECTLVVARRWRLSPPSR